MKKENIQSIVQFIVFVAILAMAYFYFPLDSEIQIYLYKVALGLGLALVVSILVWVVINFKLIWYAIRTNLPWTAWRPIRITVAYLFRIEIDGKYLLVKNNRNVPGFQPVGGVYKYLKRENAEFFDELMLTSDTRIARDVISEDDLRLEMKRRHRLLRFIKWFNKGKHREVDPWREFYEELVRPGILSQKNFPYIQYRYVRRHSQLEYSQHHKIKEYKVADIYELQLSTEAQKEEIRQLMIDGHPDVVFANADEVRNRNQGGNQITEHTFKIL